MGNRKKLLYVASTASHLHRFHEPYLSALREVCEVRTMASGEGVDFPIPFCKQFLSVRHLETIRKVRHILQAEQFDAVIVNTTLAAAVVRLALRGVKPRPYMLNVVHGYLFSDPPRGLRDRILIRVERMLAKRTDSIAVMNAHDLAAATSRRLCLGNVTFLHGMGLPERELPQPDPSIRACYAASEEILLTFVGELSKRKNQFFLIRAVATLRAEGLPVRLLLIGEGSERQHLTREISERGLGDAVFLIGSRESVFPYLAVTDLYVSASLSEGLPFNILEAMQCGLPILASDVRGQQDLLDAKRLYSSGNMDAFCAAVRQFAKHGTRGVGSVAYPNLNDYLLPSVFEENLKTLQTGVKHDKQS